LGRETPIGAAACAGSLRASPRPDRAAGGWSAPTQPAALQAAKARGRKLGSPIAAKTVVTARAARSAYAAKANATTLAVIREVQQSGVISLAGIARTLQARGVKTPGGRSQWQSVQVSRLLSA